MISYVMSGSNMIYQSKACKALPDKIVAGTRGKQNRCIECMKQFPRACSTHTWNMIAYSERILAPMMTYITLAYFILLYSVALMQYLALTTHDILPYRFDIMYSS